MGAPVTYRSPVVTVADMFDELVATGRPRRAAGVELQHALLDRAIVLTDCDPERPWDSDRLVSAAVKVVEAIMDWPHVRPSEVHHEGLHLRAYVRAARFQFEAVFGLSPAEPEQSATGEKPKQSEAAEPSQSRGGRPEKHDREEAELYAMDLLQKRGDPFDKKNKTATWRRQEDLVRAVIEHLGRIDGLENAPDASTVRRWAPGWLKKFREGEAAEKRPR